MRGITNHLKATSSRNLADRVEVLFDRHIFEYMLLELEKYPQAEEGGKFIGHILQGNDTRTDIGDPTASRIVIQDFLPGGPNAKRTQVEFMPDGEYQESLFRKAEREDPDIEHVGTWHSHHCNGLDTLSRGDIEGYFATVNKKAYRLKYFVASLVKHVPKDPRDNGWIDHFLFVRGEEEFYHLTTGVKLVDVPTSFGALTGHVLHHSHKKSAGELPVESTGVVPRLWYESEAAKEVLAHDRRLWAKHCGEQVRATRLNGRITLKAASGKGVISTTYPFASGEFGLDVAILMGSKVVISMNCDLEDRAIAYTAALAACERL